VHIPRHLLNSLSRRATVLACLMLWAFIVVPGGTAFAQANGAAAAPSMDSVLDDARKQIDGLQKAIKVETSDAELTRMRGVAQEVQATADEAATKLEPEVASVTARLTELGKPAEGAQEAPDVAEQRKQLEKSRTALDAQVKLARLLSVEAEQAVTQISGLRRAGFQARLGERTNAVMSKRFWSDVVNDFPRDLARLRVIGGEIKAGALATPVLVWVGLIAAMFALSALRKIAGRRMLKLSATKVPAGRLRRSLHALVLVILSSITPVIVALLVYVGLRANPGLSDPTAAMLFGLCGALGFGGYVAGLGSSLLSAERPSWRLPAIPDDLALRLRWFPLSMSIIMVLIWAVERVSQLAGLSLAATVALNCALGVAEVAIMMRALARSKILKRHVSLDPEHPTPPSPAWLTTVAVIGWGVLIISLICLLSGYVALGSFLVKQAGWTLVVLVSTYLFGVLIDDAFMTLRSATREVEEGQAPAAASPKARDQAAVVLSGLGRMLLLMLAVMLLLAPFGEGPGDLLQRIDFLHNGIAFGAVSIRPAAVLQALLVLAIGVMAIKLLKRWLTERYLPTTNLDDGMRVSATTLFGYAGLVAVISFSLSAVGIGLERVAWVASALSVGIGFGLQAVVQNFVCGLILLAERPVKVGDWVALGGVEGDIRRINVRATEIQMGDRSTVIVPNSEFITKTVRNVTHTNPIGLVSFKLPMPLDTDPEIVRDLIKGAFIEHPDVLETPAPNVQLDSIDGRSMIFNASGFVSSPRVAYGVKSQLLFEVLKRLRDAGMSLHAPQTMILTESPERIAAASLGVPAAVPTPMAAAPGPGAPV
jgi:small-conductance mechanosensitive channel